LTVKYALTKETALLELYGLSGAGNSKPLFKPRPTDKKGEAKTILKLTSEQQRCVLGLLRFKIIEPNHFKMIFDQGASQASSTVGTDGAKQDDADFEDVDNLVPFVGEIEDNEALAKVTPAFQKLQELSK